MPKDPHRYTLEDAHTFIANLEKVGASFCENGAWRLVPQSRELKCYLIEVWQRGAEVSVHPSRNPFHWVGTREERERLHGLATDLRWMRTLQSGNDAFNRGRVMHGRGAYVPQPKSHPKSMQTPPWAQKDRVIGYTSALPIQWHADRPSFANLESFPSVYYQNGHATIDHTQQGNIGWEYGSGYRCLYFGNVPNFAGDAYREALAARSTVRPAGH